MADLLTENMTVIPEPRAEARVLEPHAGNASREWMQHAACKGRTPLFFAPRAERPQARLRREAQARKLCTVCPVQSTCREMARANHEYGFWGGESEEDRHVAGFTVSAPIGVRARASSN